MGTHGSLPPLVCTPTQKAKLLLANPDNKNSLLSLTQPKTIEDLIEILLAYLERGQKGFDFVAELLEKHPKKFASNIITTRIDKDHGIELEPLGKELSKTADFFITTNRLAQVFFTLLPFDPEGKLVCLLLKQDWVNSIITTYSSYNTQKGADVNDALKKIVAALCYTQYGFSLLSEWLSDSSDIDDLLSAESQFLPEECIVRKKNPHSHLARILDSPNFPQIVSVAHIYRELDNFEHMEKLFKKSSQTSRAWKNFLVYYLKKINYLFNKSPDFYLRLLQEESQAPIGSICCRTRAITTELDTDDVDCLAEFIFHIFRCYKHGTKGSDKYQNDSALKNLIQLLSQSTHAYQLAEALLSEKGKNLITIFFDNKNEFIISAILDLYNKTSSSTGWVNHESRSEQALSIIDRVLTTHSAFNDNPDVFFTTLENIYRNAHVDCSKHGDLSKKDIVHFLFPPKKKLQGSGGALLFHD